MKKWLSAYCQNRKGATALEYAFLAALIALAIVAGVTGLGTNVANKFNSMSTIFG